jgi:RNA polymerase-binding transcription factor DksA
MNKKQLAHLEKRLMEERARVMKELGHEAEFATRLWPPTNEAPLTGPSGIGARAHSPSTSRRSTV